MRCDGGGSGRVILAIVAAAVLGCATGLGASPSPTRSVSVHVDRRVELVSIVFYLAGNSEYGRGRIRSYLRDVDEHFAGVRTDELIDHAADLARRMGIGYDACMSMAVHLESEDGWRLRLAGQPRPDWLDSRWRDGTASEFASRLDQFAEDSRFDEFFSQHGDLYTTTEERLKSLLDEKVHLEWFDDFFGARPTARFIVIPALLNGPSNYGPSVRMPSGAEEYYCILGVWSADWHGKPAFDASVVGTIIHEFCHSYTNAIIDRRKDQFRPAGEALFSRVKGDMSRQAYGAWETMLYESLVRASVIRYMLRFEGKGAMLREIGRQKQRGFVWIEELAGLLAQYEQARQEYPTLEDFSPRIVAFFDEYARQLPEEPETAPAPRVVSMIPANGDERVDPSLKEIPVVFDQPMRGGSWSMYGGGVQYPEVVGTPFYDQACRTVNLLPDHEYHFWLNCAWFHGFQSGRGAGLEPVEVRFKTGRGS